MESCLTPPEMSDFLSLITVPFTSTVEGLIIHAASGDVQWVWDGVMFCLNTVVPNV